MSDLPQSSSSGPRAADTGAESRQPAPQGCERLADQISAAPLASVGLAFGAGYVFAKLPVTRLVFGTIGLALPLLPHALLALGAFRAWEMVEERDPSSGGKGGSGGRELNRLLGAELSAIEAYSWVNDRFHDEEDLRALKRVRAAHEQNARRLDEILVAEGDQPLAATGRPWDGLSGALEQPASRIAESPVCALLLAGEERIVRSMEAALVATSVPEQAKSVIRQQLLPRSQENLNAILQLRAVP